MFILLVVRRHTAVHIAGGGQEYAMHLHIRLVVMSNLLCNVDK
jgi:hypothetical protein